MIVVDASVINAGIRREAIALLLRDVRFRNDLVDARLADTRARVAAEQSARRNEVIGRQFVELRAQAPA